MSDEATSSAQAMMVRLTAHANKRLAERTNLTEQECIEILTQNRCVVVGMTSFSNLIHKLFYSLKDSAYFVALQDCSNGAVITVLPLDFFENQPWEITEKRKQRALWLISPELCNISPQPGIKCTLIAILFTSGLNVVRLPLGTHRFAEQPIDAEKVLEDSQFMVTLLQRLNLHEIPMAEIEEIFIVRKNELLVRLPWRLLDSFPADLFMDDEMPGHSSLTA